MSDLISRSKLLGSMDKRYNEKCNIVPDNLAEGFMQMEKLIKEQPTAYDIDKVVDELEKASKDVSRGYLGKDNNKYHKHYKAVKLSRAIEIVKQGYVSDDVCEWKKQIKTYDWKPSCEPNSTYNVAGVGWFRFCPYCGKKIKVVELWGD